MSISEVFLQQFFFVQEYSINCQRPLKVFSVSAQQISIFQSSSLFFGLHWFAKLDLGFQNMLSLIFRINKRYQN